jgi:hypothetical protein
MNLGNLLPGFDLGDITPLIAPFMGGGDLKEKLTKFVRSQATPERIKEYGGKIIEAVAAHQARMNEKYVLLIETTAGDNDIVIKIFVRDPVTRHMPQEPKRKVFLSTLTQDDLIQVINLIIPHATGK